MRTILRLLELIFYPIVSILAKKMPKCDQCKERMEKRSSPRLFLIPVTSDHDYNESEEYYLRNCFPIASEKDIPTSQRACRFWELVCPSCGRRKIMVEDFLRVRDDEAAEKLNVYDYDSLSGLMQKEIKL